MRKEIEVDGKKYNVRMYTIEDYEGKRKRIEHCLLFKNGRGIVFKGSSLEEAVEKFKKFIREDGNK